MHATWQVKEYPVAVKPYPDLDPDDVDIVDASPTRDDRSLARRLALQILYEVDSANHPVGEVLTRHLDLRQPRAAVVRHTQTLVNGVADHLAVLDDAITRFAPEFPLDQLAVIDRNILRLAIYEFAVAARAPVGVAIDEAVELAKLFGGDNAPGFINGVLGTLAESSDALTLLRAEEEEDVS